VLVLDSAETNAATSLKARRIWWAVAWIGVAVGIFLRVYKLGSESLWFDEGYTAWMVSHSPPEIIHLIRADTAPPLYYLLLHGWANWFGRSEAALRSLSAVISIITLFIAVDIARKFLRNPAAIAIAVWATAISFLQIWYAQEARAYALMAMLGAGAFDLCLYHLAGKHRRSILPLAILIAAGMYSHNMMGTYVVGLLLTWLILPSEQSTRRRLGDIGITVALALVLYLPWVIGGLPNQMQLIRHRFWVEPLTAGGFFSGIAALMGVKQYWSWAALVDHLHISIGDSWRPALIAIALLIVSGVLSIGLQLGSRRREAVGLLVAAIFPPVTIAIYSVLATPLFMQKVLLPSAVLLPIFVLLPLGARWQPAIRNGAWIGASILLVLSGLTLYGHMAEDRKENWRQLAKVVSELPGKRRLIIFVANDGQLPFDYYYRAQAGAEETGVPAGFFNLNPPQTMRRMPEDGNLAPLESLLDSNHFDQVVLVIAHEGWGDPNQLTQQMLAKRWPIAGRTELNDLAVQWYQLGQ
jgi:uncharacterized membrane protein